MWWLNFGRLCSQSKKETLGKWIFLLQTRKGDHEKWKSQDGKIVIVDHKILSRHTANEILKQAGIGKSF